MKFQYWIYLSLAILASFSSNVEGAYCYSCYSWQCCCNRPRCEMQTSCDSCPCAKPACEPCCEVYTVPCNQPFYAPCPPRCVEPCSPCPKPSNPCPKPCNPCPEPCQPKAAQPCNGWKLGADFIYWKPCVSDIDYATVTLVSGSSPDYQYKEMCLSWEPGFRIYFAKEHALCDLGLNASYTWLDTCTKSTVTSKEPTVDYNIVTPYIQFNNLPASPDQLVATYDSSYQSWDIFLSYELPTCGCHRLLPFFGVEGLILNQKLRTNIFTGSTDAYPTHNQKWTADYSGVGLKIGSDYHYAMMDCLEVFSRFSGTAVVGSVSNDKNVFYTQNADTGAVGDDVDTYRGEGGCQIIPGFHFQAGFSYTATFCSCEMDLRVGYEFLYWLNVPTPRKFERGESNGNNDSLIRSSSSKAVNMGLHGILAGLSTTF